MHLPVRISFFGLEVRMRLVMRTLPKLGHKSLQCSSHLVVVARLSPGRSCWQSQTRGEPVSPPFTALHAAACSARCASSRTQASHRRQLNDELTSTSLVPSVSSFEFPSFISRAATESRRDSSYWTHLVTRVPGASPKHASPSSSSICDLVRTIGRVALAEPTPGLTPS